MERGREKREGQGGREGQREVGPVRLESSSPWEAARAPTHASLRPRPPQTSSPPIPTGSLPPSLALSSCLGPICAPQASGSFLGRGPGQLLWLCLGRGGVLGAVMGPAPAGGSWKPVRERWLSLLVPEGRAPRDPWCVRGHWGTPASDSPNWEETLRGPENVPHFPQPLEWRVGLSLELDKNPQWVDLGGVVLGPLVLGQRLRKW